MTDALRANTAAPSQSVVWHRWASDQMMPLRHQDAAHVLFLDSHVESARPERIGPAAWRESNLPGNIRGHAANGEVMDWFPSE